VSGESEARPGLEHRLPHLVLSAPSGAGKTTIARRLVASPDPFVFSVSATTRSPRRGEVNGVDYHFLTRDEFRSRVAEGAMAEWAEVHGDLYGTPLQNLFDAEGEGRSVVLDIDVQGARQIRERVPEAVLIFILPPSGRVLVERLKGRGTEGEAALRRRMDTARGELEAIGEFDHVVVNDDLDRAVDEIRGILAGALPGGEPAVDLERLLDEILEAIA
jgi:guanylate kinase